VPPPGFELASCLGRLADRNPGRTEADIQSVLLYGGFDLGDHQVRLETPAEDRKRLDVEVGALVIECKRDLRRVRVVRDGEDQLAVYVWERLRTRGTAYVGILTDGVMWRLYRPSDAGQVSHVATFNLAGPDSSQDFRWWLGAILATETSLRPTSSAITARLGSDSPFFKLSVADLRALWAAAAHDTSVALKRTLWAKLLSTALGTQFRDDDSLFVEHTYLVLLGSLVGQAVVGIDLRSYLDAPAALLTGELFTSAGISGVGEAGFFDWVVEVDGGKRFLQRLAREVMTFAWQDVEHDVLKSLYQSVIAQVTRHDLGEYYTPDWLAERMAIEVIDDPLTQRVLDPACGSGTFLFHAVRRYLDAADAAGVSVGDAVVRVSDFVIGLDLHPVAVVLAQVTYLLAIGNERLRERSGAISVPVYLGDSMRWDEHTEQGIHEQGQLVIRTDEGRIFGAELRFPAGLVDDPARFDELVSAMADLATNRAPGTAARSVLPLLRRFGIGENDQAVLRSTYSVLCDLHDTGRNHVWGFFVRNQARPAWLAAAANRVDVLIGNPPWLSYRYMPAEMQERFRSRSRERHLWTGRQVATQQDLSAFFVVRSVELFLRAGGKFAFVMPRAVLSRQPYEGFRLGRYHVVNIDFGRSWDLGGVRPQPFLVPSAVVFGSSLPNLESPQHSLGASTLAWSGRVVTHGTSSVVDAQLTSEPAEVRRVRVDDEGRSPYAARFRNGAFLVPRMLVFVEDTPAPPFGLPPGQRSVGSRRSSLEKRPWRDLPAITGDVEELLVRAVHLGETVLPFRLLEPLEAVLPFDGRRLLDSPNLVERYLDSAIHHLSAVRAYRGGSHLAHLRPAQSPTRTRSWSTRSPVCGSCSSATLPSSPS
jgi:hypothetical protein